MSRSVDAIQLGLAYQARFFWSEAAVRLLNEASPVCRIGFDVARVNLAILRHEDVAEPDRQAVAVSLGAGFADGHDHPAPVRVFTRDGGFDQWGVRDGTGDQL